MQKLTYINTLGESLVFGATPPYIFGKIRGTGSTGLVISTLQGVQQGGDSTVGVRKEHREVDLTFSIVGASVADLYTARRRLCGALAAGKAFDGPQRARIFYENDAGRWWTWAIPQTPPGFEDRIDRYHLDLPLMFRCESPYWYSPSKSSVQLAFSGGAGFGFPFQFPIKFGSKAFAMEVQNTGHVAAPVEIIIEGHGETPSLLNEATGARVKLIAPLPIGDKLTINTDPALLAAIVEQSDGNVAGAFGLLDVSSPLTAFMLRPGSNRLVYEPGASAALSKITAQWYTQYEGV